MKFFMCFLDFFTSITTAITAVVGIITLIEGAACLPNYITLQIIAAGAVSALLTAAVHSTEYKSRRVFLIITAVHYLLLCAAMSIFGVLFGWVDKTAAGIGLMCVYVAAVYAAVYGISYLRAKSDADKINRALREKNSAPEKRS